MKKVVTWTVLDESGKFISWDLCIDCIEEVEQATIMGCVQHGAHDGECRICESKEGDQQ